MLALFFLILIFYYVRTGYLQNGVRQWLDRASKQSAEEITQFKFELWRARFDRIDELNTFPRYLQALFCFWKPLKHFYPDVEDFWPEIIEEETNDNSVKDGTHPD